MHPIEDSIATYTIQVMLACVLIAFVWLTDQSNAQRGVWTLL